MNDRAFPTIDSFSPLNVHLPKKTKHDRFSLFQFRQWVRQVIDDPTFIHYPDFHDPIYHFTNQEFERLTYAIKLEMQHNKKCKGAGIFNQCLQGNERLQSKWQYLEHTKYSPHKKIYYPKESKKYKTFHDAWAIALVELACIKAQKKEVDSIYEYLCEWDASGIFNGLHPDTSKRIWSNVVDFIHMHQLFNLPAITASYPLVEKYREKLWNGHPDNINWKHATLIFHAIDNNINKDELLKACARKLEGDIHQLLERQQNLSNHAAIVFSLKDDIEKIAPFKTIQQESPYKEIIGTWMLALTRAQKQSNFPSYEIARFLKNYLPDGMVNKYSSTYELSEEYLLDILNNLNIRDVPNFISQWKLAQQLDIPIPQWIQYAKASKEVTDSLDASDIIPLETSNNF